MVVAVLFPMANKRKQPGWPSTDDNVRCTVAFYASVNGAGKWRPLDIMLSEISQTHVLHIYKPKYKIVYVHDIYM